MRNYLPVALKTLIVCVAALSSTCDSKRESIQTPLVMAAIVEQIGKHPGATSGYYKIYQLAKYRVVTVCAGAYQQDEIVVDHLLVSGDELKSLRPGDRVYLTLSASRTISLRSNEEGFRTASQNVDTFYIAGKPDLTPPAECKE